MSLFADKSRKKLNGLQDLQRYLFYTQIGQNSISYHYLEKLLIQLLGHSEIDVRDQSIVLLNMLIDGVDWQFAEAFTPVVTCVESEFILNISVLSKEPLKDVVVMLNAPSNYSDCELAVITWHKVKVQPGRGKDEYVVSTKFKNFWRCGFYDWKVVAIDQLGKMEMLKNYHKSGDRIFAQGRYIVEPKDASLQQIHEIMVDYKDNDSDQDKNFITLAKEVQGYAKQGITALYLLGALERDNGVIYEGDSSVVREIQRPFASPLAITDRSCANKMLGGDHGCSLLVEEAKKRGIKVLVDCLTRVSSSRLHRKYKKALLRTLDSDGKLIVCYGTDGRAIKYEDTALLNYRKLRSWKLLVDDIKTFALKYKVEGVHLDNGQAWPQIMELDESEMYRKDSDGKPAYTEKEILDGEVVIKNENHGYWNSTNVDTYANPMLVKLCKELWKDFPEFYIVGECWGGYPFENRQGILARSGVIPRLFKLPIALASLFGKQLHKDGKITPCHPQTVDAIRFWYENNRKFLPEGAYLIQSSSSHSWPYPAHLYGRGAWSAVDVLFFMPDIPMTFMGEIFGHVFRKNTTNVYQAQTLPKAQLQRAKSQLRIAMEEHDQYEEDPQVTAPPSKEDPEQEKKLVRVRSSSLVTAIKNVNEVKRKEEEVTKQLGPEYGFDLKKIQLHYEHRRNLRKEKAVLRHGLLIPLSAKHSEGWHSHVLAFARFSHAETAIIAINFTDSQVSFFIDFANLLPHFEKHYHTNTVVMFSDWMKESETEYYFLMELIKDKMPFTLPPFGSICKGIKICKDEPLLYAVSIQKSFARLNTKVIANKDCSNTQLCEYLFSTVTQGKSLNDFAMVLAYIFNKFLHPQKIHMHVLLHRLGIISENPVIGGKLFAYCWKIYQYKAKNPQISQFSAIQAIEEMCLTNKLGPIVFLAPELGRWSTVGGLGVMVDELTQGLALLNEDVYVITPYYNKNRKGEEGYLANDPGGFSYYKSFQVKAANGQYGIGVHRGVVNKVKLVFLHNAELFPTVYSEGGAALILRQISVFAKASLEYLCTEQFIPSVVVTNDWFTGLVPAYAKFGAFGDVFKGTTFLHIFHNLQELYEGRLYPNPADGTLAHIHQLPNYLLVDPGWKNTIINPSRCAILACDQWATVSPSYRNDLLSSSPLAFLLRNHPRVNL